MPLLKGKENIGTNIKTEEAAGKPHDQAVAIALHTAYDGKTDFHGQHKHLHISKIMHSKEENHG